VSRTHRARDLLRLTLTPGVGPVRARALLARFGSVEAIAAASARELDEVRGIGEVTARQVREGLAAADDAADRELELAHSLGVSLIALGDENYPPLLAELPDAPILLYVRGRLSPARDTYSVAIVGSRRCTAYGTEQAARFAMMLSQSGLVIVSGGARGIDTAAHQGALRVNGATVAVLGCGLAHSYPPENDELFRRIVDAGGAIVSELPLSTSPAPENFPARNRIISGMSLGVLVIEAPHGSGSLITAKHAMEAQGRDVMALPGRVDSKASEGSHELIRCGATLVTNPGDVLDALEQPARHHFAGTHADRYAPAPKTDEKNDSPALFDPSQVVDGRTTAVAPEHHAEVPLPSLTETQRRIVDLLGTPRTMEDLAEHSGMDVATLRAETTLLEIRRVIARNGSHLVRRGSESQTRPPKKPL